MRESITIAVVGFIAWNGYQILCPPDFPAIKYRS